MPEYDALAARYGTLFNRSEWLGLFGEHVRIYGLFEDAGQMMGGFSLFRDQWFGIPILRSAPYTPNCGPFLEIKAQNPVAVLEAWRKALECVAEFLDHQRPSVVMLPLDQRITDVLPFYWRKFKAAPRYTYLNDVTIPLERIRKNMSRCVATTFRRRCATVWWSGPRQT